MFLAELPPSMPPAPRVDLGRAALLLLLAVVLLLILLRRPRRRRPRHV